MTRFASAWPLISLMGGMLALHSCQSLPQLFQAAEDIATDEAIIVEVDKAAIQKETDVRINVEVINRDPPK